jgi:hypothetical protein
MGTFQFISSIVQSIASLAWPLAFFGAVWLFREKVRELLPLFRVKYKDVEASFRLDQAEKEVQALPPVHGIPEALPTPEEKSRFDQLAEISSRAAILEARADLEEAVRQLGSVSDMSDKAKTRSIALIVRNLRNQGVIGSETSALLDDLRAVGNSAAHGDEKIFSKDEALRYRKLTESAIYRLNDLYRDIVDHHREDPRDD